MWPIQSFNDTFRNPDFFFFFFLTFCFVIPGMPSHFPQDHRVAAAAPELTSLFRSRKKTLFSSLHLFFFEELRNIFTKLWHCILTLSPLTELGHRTLSKQIKEGGWNCHDWLKWINTYASGCVWGLLWIHHPGVEDKQNRSPWGRDVCAHTCVCLCWVRMDLCRRWWCELENSSHAVCISCVDGSPPPKRILESETG